jgi:DNA-binding GntR family transcriptional regulator
MDNHEAIHMKIDGGPKGSTDRAYNRIISLIANRTLQAGNLIEARTIAAELDISMSPVTRALQRLEQEGLVRIVPRTGSFVEEGDLQTLFDNMMMREALECQAARIYCGSPIEENLDTLHELARKVDAIPSIASPELDPDRWLADIAFHQFLVSLSRNSVLIKAFGNIMRIGILLNLNMFARSTEQSENHVELANALVTRDSDEAERLIRSHLRSHKPSPREFSEVLGHKTWDDL